MDIIVSLFDTVPMSLIYTINAVNVGPVNVRSSLRLKMSFPQSAPGYRHVQFWVQSYTFLFQIVVINV